MTLRTAIATGRALGVRFFPLRGLGLLITMLAGSVHAGGVVRVPASVAVDAPVIALGDIAAFDGIAAETEQQLSVLAFGPSGDPAQQRVISGARIREAIEAIDSSVLVDVPEQITVRRSGTELSAQELQERIERAVRHSMPWPADAVSLESWSLPRSMRAPVGFTRLLVQFRPREDFRGRVAVELELVDPTQPEQRGVRRSATLEIEVRVPVAIAARPLRRGEELGDDAIRFETRELRRLPDDVIVDAEHALGQTLRVAVREGSPLIGGYFASADVVKRGDILQVDAGHSGLTLRLEVRALEAGGLGQVIRAQNPSTRRELRVEITGPREARLAQADVGVAR